MSHHDIITTINQEPNSYEFGKSGSRFKLYFKDAVQLASIIEGLKSWGFPVDDAFKITDKKGVGIDDTANN